MQMAKLQKVSFLETFSMAAPPSGLERGIIKLRSILNYIDLKGSLYILVPFLPPFCFDYSSIILYLNGIHF